MRRGLVLAALVVGALLVVATAATAGLRVAHRGEILPGVTVADAEVGGLSPQDARDALRPVVAQRETEPVTLTFREQEFVLDPADVDYRVDLEATVDAAMAAGRGGNPFASSWNHVSAYWDETALELQGAWDSEAVAGWVDDIAAEVERAVSIGDVGVDPDTLEVLVAYPEDGVDVREDAAVATVEAGLASPGPDTEPLPADITPTPIRRSTVDEVASQAERAVAAPLTLRSGPADASVVLAPPDVAPLIDMEQVEGDDGPTVALAVPVGKVKQVFADLAEQFRVEPTPARFSAPRQPPVTLDDKTDVTWRPRSAAEIVDIDPSAPGYEFDAEMAASQLTPILRRGIREAELRLETHTPDFTTADAEELDITELLGTFTTYHSCCQNRVTNIHRLADMVDGTVVRPGEQFSVNQISGVRECSKGFAAAGMILRGEIVDVCGGGVSQFGTTMVNAIFFSGLDPDAYQPHSFYISRYPMGREATLNYPSPDIDVAFTNETGHGILVKTGYTSTSITVSLYGQNDVASVSAIHGSPHSYRAPETRTRTNEALPPGTSRVVQSGSSGFSIGVTRVVTYEDGREERDDWSNTYVPQHEIVERNPA